MLVWTRVENWSETTPQFVELAVDGTVLWVRRGSVRAGRRPVVERRALETQDEAETALATELGKLRRRKFDEQKRFERQAPSAADLAWKPDRALSRGSSRWPPAEARTRKQAFFERLRQCGIDPTRPFAVQASEGGGADGGATRD